MQFSIRVKFLLPLLAGGALMALLGAWASYEAALDELRHQILKRGELLGTALNEAAKATRSDDELRFAVEEIVAQASSVYGIAVATRDPIVIWASSFRPGTDQDALTQSMLKTLHQTLEAGTFGHYFADDGDLVTLMPLSLRAAALAGVMESTVDGHAFWPRPGDAAEEYFKGFQYSLPPVRYRGAIYLRFDWDSVKQASGSILRRSIMFMLLGIAMMGILAYWLLHRTVLMPMSVIGTAMEHQKEGKEEVRVPALKGGEIGQLGLMFNQMLDAVHERDRRFRAVVDHLPIAVCLKSIDSSYVLSNQVYEKWLGAPCADIDNSSESACAIKDDLTPRYLEGERRVVDGGEPVTWEEQYEAHDGQRRAFVTTMFPVFDVEGRVEAIGCASTDISDRKRDEDELRQLSKAVESAGNGILIADARLPDFPITYANPAVERLTGYSTNEFLGRNPRFLHADDRNQPGLEEIRSALKNRRACKAILRNFRKDGTEFWIDFTLSPVCDKDGIVSHYIGIQNDITERKKAEQHIQSLAYFDALTKVPNRVLFHDRLQQALTHATRSRSNVGLLYIDLDNFKAVNDSLGHEAGDRLLQEVAQRIGRCVRQWDTIARMGGDEFTVIVENLPPSKTEHTLTAIAEKVSTVLSEPILLAEQEFIVTASIGVAHHPRDGSSVEELVKNADMAMYHSKSMGRNNWQFFQSALDVAAKQQRRVETELRQALKRREMTLNYQPQLDLASGRPDGVEVLLRWTSPILDVVPPRVFIPAAESTGEIVQLGEWVLRQACRRFKRWQFEGMPISRLSVNLSPRQFRQSEFVSRVSEILREFELDPSCLELEVTESSIIHDPETAVAMLHDLKQLGVRVAMDDFGTGYSSLRYLRDMPIDLVKIDRSFIRDIPGDAGDVEIVTAIIAMARGLKKEVVAEGVENEEQFELLANLGCDKVQGHLFSEPLPEAEFARWMWLHFREPSDYRSSRTPPAAG